MDETRRFESKLLEIYQCNAPSPALDELLTASTPRPAAGCAFGAVYSGHPSMGDTEFGNRCQSLTILHGFFIFQSLEEGFGALVSGAVEMKPESHLAFAKGVWLAFSEA